MASEIEGILDDNMNKTDKTEVSIIIGDFKIIDKNYVADVCAIVGVKGIMRKLKFKLHFSHSKEHLHHARCLVQWPYTTS